MVETVGFCQVMWFVMLKSAKDRILEVDPQYNICHHVSDMEWHHTLCHARLSVMLS
jgi:hypothetical protein